MSLVFECLEVSGVDITEPLPMMEGGNIDLIAEYMTGECKEAKNTILQANKLFKKGQYKEAERLYVKAKKMFSNVRGRSSQIRTVQAADFAVSVTYFTALFTPILQLLVILPPLISESRLLTDSASMINKLQLQQDVGQTTSLIKNLVVTRCKACELACDDKIKRCRSSAD